MRDRITEIINGIIDKHGFDYTESDLLAIEFGVDILEAFGQPDVERVDRVITDAALLIGLRNKFPDVPVHYAFVFTN